MDRRVAVVELPYRLYPQPVLEDFEDVFLSSTGVDMLDRVGAADINQGLYRLGLMVLFLIREEGRLIGGLAHSWLRSLVRRPEREAPFLGVLRTGGVRTRRTGWLAQALQREVGLPYRFLHLKCRLLALKRLLRLLRAPLQREQLLIGFLIGFLVHVLVFATTAMMDGFVFQRRIVLLCRRALSGRPGRSLAPGGGSGCRVAGGEVRPRGLLDNTATARCVCWCSLRLGGLRGHGRYVEAVPRGSTLGI